MALIELRNIEKIYTMGEDTVRALDGVDLDIENGEYISIMGPSGSGKSTMLNIIGCLDVPSAGDYTLDSVRVEKLSDRQLAVTRNTTIGFVFQHFHLLKNLNALENVELPLIYSNVSAQYRRERAKEALALVGLEDRMKHKSAQLSGGQRQRVAIARALVTQPKIIMADEPTGALDSKTGESIMELFQKMNEDTGITIVQVTHDAKVATYGKKTYHMLDGKINRVEG